MFEAKLTIEAADLAAAINNLAAAISGTKSTSAEKAVTMPTPTAPTPVTAMPTPVVPAAPPVPTAPSMNYPMPSVPLAAPPKYTVDQIMAAGATLMDSGKVNELMNLLHSFGVQAVMDLKPEQLGAFATAMRDLGARI